MECSVYVTKRAYGAPGPCENEKEIRPSEYDGKTPMMCCAHRAMAARGQQLTLHRDVSAADHKRRVAEIR